MQRDNIECNGAKYENTNKGMFMYVGVVSL